MGIGKGLMIGIEIEIGRVVIEIGTLRVSLPKIRDLVVYINN